MRFPDFQCLLDVNFGNQDILYIDRHWAHVQSWFFHLLSLTVSMFRSYTEVVYHARIRIDEHLCLQLPLNGSLQELLIATQRQWTSSIYISQYCNSFFAWLSSETLLCLCCPSAWTARPTGCRQHHIAVRTMYNIRLQNFIVYNNIAGSTNDDYINHST